jgi:hypothetical protein
VISIGAVSHEQLAARSSRADAASTSPYTIGPTVGSTGQGRIEGEHETARRMVGSRRGQGCVEDAVSAQRYGAEAAAQQAEREDHPRGKREGGKE